MNQSNFNNLLQTVEFELTQRQRFLLFEHLYTTYSFPLMVKFEKTMLNQIKSSTEMLNNKDTEEVTKACNIILKSYKQLDKQLK